MLSMKTLCQAGVVHHRLVTRGGRLHGAAEACERIGQYLFASRSEERERGIPPFVRRMPGIAIEFDQPVEVRLLKRSGADDHRGGSYSLRVSRDHGEDMWASATDPACMNRNEVEIVE